MTVKKYARIALECLDLTSLDEKDNEEKIKQICDKAVGNYGTVAAVCIRPQFIELAKGILKNSNVKTATVINFPRGDMDAKQAVLEAKTAKDTGVDEIELVYPYHKYLAGDKEAANDVLRAVREECKGLVLKVTIETGAIQKALHIARITKECATNGADFIKTSTGMIEIGATPESANAVLEAIKESGNKKLGFKAAGHIDNIEQARSYIDIATSIMGEKYINPKTFRIGASYKLFNSIISTLGY